MPAPQSLKCLIISDQLIPGRANYGACHDVFEMTKRFGSVYLEAEFADGPRVGAFDLLLISGHASASGAVINIDGTDLVIQRHLAEIRARIVYLNACDAGRNVELLTQCFAALGAEAIVAPMSKVPWGSWDNEATRIFVRSLLNGYDVSDAIRACDPVWPTENPYSVHYRETKPNEA